MFEPSSQSSKAVWLALLVVALAVLVFFVLIQRNKKTATPEPATTANSSQTGAAADSSSSSIPMEKAQTQFQTIQDQVNAGTLSPEEAEKQMDALGAQIAPPDLPAEANK